MMGAPKWLRDQARHEMEASMLPLHAFVLARGERFVSEPLTEREAEIVRAAVGRKTFAPKACFHNAQKILFADESERLTYVEGFGGRIHHGWLAIGRKVIDPTWGSRDVEYFGVRFSRDVVKASTSPQCASLLDDWQAGWPILSTPSDGWPGWDRKAARIAREARE